MKMEKKHKYSYRWKLKETNFTKDKGKVMSCFACGGGSTMGYKLAGYDVIAANEIDPRMMKIYRSNHHPKYSFLCDIRDLKRKIQKCEATMKEELYSLDILDASFPCSPFSMSGNREKDWGKTKKFREGQKSQLLDDLAFYVIDLAKELRPKVVICENVKGIILGNAKKYTKRIHEEFWKAGYYCQHFLLSAEDMGVPQRRPRVFFLCLRNDLANDFLVQQDLFVSTPYINMEFKEPPILYGDIEDNTDAVYFTPTVKSIWEQRIDGDSLLCDAYERQYHKRKYFDFSFAYRSRVAPTLTSHRESVISFTEPRYMSDNEIIHISSFPEDYNFGTEKPIYVCGMSVPPVMMANVASRVYDHWLSKL